MKDKLNKVRNKFFSSKKNIVLFVLAVFSFVTIGYSLAQFMPTIIKIADKKSSVLEAGTLNVSIDDENMDLNSLSPIYDDEYLTEAYKKTFNIVNVGTLSGCTNIYLSFTNLSSTLHSQYVKYKLINGTDEYNGDFSSVSDNKLLLASNNFTRQGSSRNFTLYIWLSYDEDVDQTSLLNNSFSVSISTSTTICASTDDTFTVTFNPGSGTISGSNTITVAPNMTYGSLPRATLDGKVAVWNYNNKKITTSSLVTETSAFTASAVYSSVLYDFVASESLGSGDTFDFNNPSSKTNGRGVYTYAHNSTNGTVDSETGSETIYYYRGNVTNNNVIFAGYCWLIIRTTDTGGVKLLYNGTPSNGTCSSYRTTASNVPFISTGRMWNDDTYSVLYSASNIKTTVDSWISTNLSSYSSNLETINWCNDTNGQQYDSSTNYNYPGYTRFNNGTPKLECTNNSDKYSLTSALLTVDEVMLAGQSKRSDSTNLDSYINVYQKYYWLLSASHVSSNHGWIFNSYGPNSCIGSSRADYSIAVRPSISLISGMLVTGGDGSVSSPYTVGSSLYSEIASQTLGTGSELNSGSGINYKNPSSTTNGSGVYTYTRDSSKGTIDSESGTKTIYYYRGNVTNNNVLFAGYCWLIVRTTDTGGVKLLYNGTPSSGTCPSYRTTSSTTPLISSGAYWNNNTLSTLYSLSTVKTTVDSWISTNLSGYSSKLETINWCNDSNNQQFNLYNEVYYPGYTRWNNGTPQLECTNDSDKYSLTGALLTADEAMLAGQSKKSDSSKNSYINIYNKYWWLLTPSDTSWNRTGIFYSYGYDSSIDGPLGYADTTSGVRVAIALNFNTAISSGSGTVSEPYVIQ